MRNIVSIIIPIYNKEKTLARCIDSILDQSYENFELLLIDDGSTDGSGAICDRYAKRDNRIRLIKKENGGPSSARNVGLREMQGDYLIFADADDFCGKDFVKLLFDAIKSSDAEMVIGHWYVNDGRHIDNQIPEIGKAGTYDAETVRNMIVHDDFMYGGGFLWNRIIDYKKIIENTGKHVFFDEDLFMYEDKLWLIEVLRNCRKVMIIDDVLYNYTLDPDSLSHSITKRKCENRLLAWDRISSLLSGKLDDETRLVRNREVVFAVWELRRFDKAAAVCAYKKYKELFREASLIKKTVSIKAFILECYGFLIRK